MAATVTFGQPVAGSAEVLQAQHVTKRFAGVAALSDVTVAVRPGEVLGLVGHNGAGKSTLLRVLSGAYRPDEGAVMLGGQALSLGRPADALAHGITTVYQELSLLPNLTVTQNVFLSREQTRLGVTAGRRMRAQARELVDRFDLPVDVDEPLATYPVAIRQLLEIAVATHREARFLLLDEPSTSLEGPQVDRLLALVDSLAHHQGLGVMLVDHKLDEIYAVSDRVVALVDGRVRLEGAVGDVPRAQVVGAITGGIALAQREPEPLATDPIPDGAAPTGRHRVEGAPAATGGVRVIDLRSRALHGVSLTCAPGRVLGLYGLVGSGRSEFLRSLIGIERIVSGRIEIDGREYRPRDPGSAARLGIVHLTEERKIDGIVPQLDSRINVALPVLHRFQRLGVLDRAAARRAADDLLTRLRVRGDVTAPVVSLSGGNQQKVLLARALAQRPRVLLLDEPTKGVDIGVKAEIHRIVRDLAHREGLTVLMVSSEDEEILEMADEVVVFVGGRCTGIATPTADLRSADLRAAAWEGSLMNELDSTAARRQQIVAAGAGVVRVESAGVAAVAAQLDDSFAEVVDVLLQCQGKVFITGSGTSGFIARRMAHLLSVCGTPATYLQPMDALHGGMGALGTGDALIAISRGGGSTEINDLVTRVRGRGVVTIALTGRNETELTRASDHVVVLQTPEGADPGEVIAMGSTLVVAVWGDALALVLMQLRGYTWDQMLHTHPAGAVGQVDRPPSPLDLLGTNSIGTHSSGSDSAAGA